MIDGIFDLLVKQIISCRASLSIECEDYTSYLFHKVIDSVLVFLKSTTEELPGSRVVEKLRAAFLGVRDDSEPKRPKANKFDASRNLIPEK